MSNLAVSTPQVTVINGRIFTTSTQIADSFDKQHKLVLRSVRDLQCSPEFRECNFAPSSYKSGNRQYPMYLITRDGFAFLAMGFTGHKAGIWKERYIAAFNAMEEQLKAEQAAAEAAAKAHPPLPPAALALTPNTFTPKEICDGMRVLINSVESLCLRATAESQPVATPAVAPAQRLLDDGTMAGRTINLPKMLWAALDEEARRCRRSSTAQLRALLEIYFGLGDPEFDAAVFEKARDYFGIKN